MEQVAAQMAALSEQVAILQRQNEEKDAQVKDLKRKLEKAQYYADHPNASRTPPPQTQPEPEPEPTTQEGIMTALLKAFLTKEKKVQIPEPHDWDRDRKALDTFFRECKVWLEDRGLTDDPDDHRTRRKAIMIIVGHMKGQASQWVTTQMKIHGLHMDKIWPTRGGFWKDLKERFGDSDPHFSA